MAQQPAKNKQQSSYRVSCKWSGFILFEITLFFMRLKGGNQDERILIMQSSR